jgi:hypothetical protein
LKKLLKLLSLYQAARHGQYHGPSYKPWKGGKRKGRKRDRYGAYGHPPSPPPYGHGFDHDPYGHARPRGLKGVVIDAIVRKLLKHR